MPYEEKQMPHHIMLEGRGSLTVSGVEEVESFDENTIVMVTVKGTLVVRGLPTVATRPSLSGFAQPAMPSPPASANPAAHRASSRPSAAMATIRWTRPAQSRCSVGCRARLTTASSSILHRYRPCPGRGFYLLSFDADLHVLPINLTGHKECVVSFCD